MRSGFRRKWDLLDLRIESTFRKHKARKKAHIRLKRMHGGYVRKDILTKQKYRHV